MSIALSQRLVGGADLAISRDDPASGMSMDRGGTVHSVLALSAYFRRLKVSCSPFSLLNSFCLRLFLFVRS